MLYFELLTVKSIMINIYEILQKFDNDFLVCGSSSKLWKNSERDEDMGISLTTL